MKRNGIFPHLSSMNIEFVIIVIEKYTFDRNIVVLVINALDTLIIIVGMYMYQIFYSIILLISLLFTYLLCVHIYIYIEDTSERTIRITLFLFPISFPFFCFA